MNIAARAFAPSTAELLGGAVHQNRMLSVDGVLERAFTFAFRSLVYPQIWEDPRVDMEALDLQPSSRMMTIASGGCKALSYLIANPARIYAVDLNAAHVALLRLKIEAAKRLPNHATFFRFFGAADDRRNVRLYDDLIAPNLDEATRAYWEARGLNASRRISRFGCNFYRFGVLGRFIGAAHIAARALGADPSRILAAKTREEQRRIFDSELAPLFERRVVRWLASRRASLFGLGIPPAQYDALCDYGQRHMADVLKQRVERLATSFDLADNYFASQAFGRAYSQEAAAACPPYLSKDGFPAMKSRVNRLTVVQENMIQFLAGEPAESLDRFSLLDAQDWMDDATLNALWRGLTRAARPGARVIFRTAGAKTILPGRVNPAILDRWRYEAETSAALFAKDRSAIYGGFHLYVKAP